MRIQTMSKRYLPAAALMGALCASGASLATAGTAVAQTDTPCPGNETSSVVVQGCLPSTAPSPDALDQRGPNQVPKIDGIPCTGTNTGTCIGLSRLPSADAPEPDTSVQQSR